MTGVLVFVAMVALVGGTLWLIAREMSKSALHPTLTWDPINPARGEALEITVEVTPRRAIAVRQVEAHLVANRYAFSSDSQTDLAIRVTGETPIGPCEKDTVCHCKVLLCREMMFQPGQPIKLIGTLDIPFDALPTHRDGALQIHWMVSARFDILHFPPLVVSMPIEVSRDVYGRQRRERQMPQVFGAQEVPVLLEPVVPASAPSLRLRHDPPVRHLELDAAKPAPLVRPHQVSLDPASTPEPPPPPAKSGGQFDHLEI
ncbi:MAG: hypothetical protein ACYCW6_20100 [Candidatus Xenobia bacterium]